ncbi:MAG: PAS domain-containing sensor histidine kinase [Ignavibacteriae bacterium]|nr:PAS domain-containing sensor histidine kinase [Ignavibacteriota bacterium]NOG97866.1 PAS domain-containing sensor histidine kinase [Ignavibacteriota bacterium]
MKTYNRILLLSFLFGLAAWVFSTLIDYIFFYRGSFFDLLILKIPPEEYLSRIIVVLLFMVFALIMVKYIVPLEEVIHKNKLRKNAYDNLLNLTQEIIVGLDKDGFVNAINNRGCEIIGMDREEIIGKNWFSNFVPSRLRFELQKSFDRMMVGETEKWFYYESSLMTKGGNEKLIFWHHSVVLSVDGIIEGTLSAGADITSNMQSELEKKKLTSKMEEQANLLEIILLAAPDMIFMWDDEGRFTYVNFQAAQSLNLDRFEMIGKNWIELNLPTEQINALEAKRKLTMVSGDSVTDEITFNTVAGPRDYEYILTPVKNNEGVVDNVVFSARDITDRKTHEVELMEAKIKAQESDKLKSEFLSQMSHEVRTPLHTILSYISLIKDDIKNSGSSIVENSFRSIDIGSKRLLRTIDMILNMSQIQTGTYEPDFREFDISKDIVASAVNEMWQLIKDKNLKLNFNDEVENAVLKVDRYTTTQIFRNILDNAVKYTLTGSIEVNIYKNEKKKICVDIKDTGIGIGSEYISKLFKPFSQEETGFSRRYEGNGLGLALSKKYCELNNADIKVKSEKGKGSVFTVVFKQQT